MALRKIGRRVWDIEDVEHLNSLETYLSFHKYRKPCGFARAGLWHHKTALFHRFHSRGSKNSCFRTARVSSNRAWPEATGGLPSLNGKGALRASETEGGQHSKSL